MKTKFFKNIVETRCIASLLFFLCPLLLSAQNGVTVGGLDATAGTVTFSVSWDRDAMPVTVWSDTVWVFADYSVAGDTVRLSLLPGATLTATSAPGTGKVKEETDNNTGVWVVGNARTNGSFSATVRLLTPAAGAVGIIFTYMPPGTAQPQGSCTYTEPAPVNTFAAFPNTYSAATYVTLTDARDGKIYPVVQIDGQWIMARNLNYQEGLTWQANSNQPSTLAGSGSLTIGHFWCPGTAGAATSTRASCDVYGALYAWETAMSFNGLGSWSENATYNTDAASATNSNFNHGRTASGTGTGGRGICPQNWHVPTDFEWGVVLDGMEGDGQGTVHQNASGDGWYGEDSQLGAGARGKSKCMCASGTCATDEAASWTYSSSDAYRGSDAYGFRVLPAGYRNANGSSFNYRGTFATFWSSSAYSATLAWYRVFNYSYGNVYRTYHNRSFGFSVRCIRDE
jgi:uncharacterized protein (TIGR02145 family)